MFFPHETTGIFTLYLPVLRLQDFASLPSTVFIKNINIYQFFLGSVNPKFEGEFL